MSLNLQFSGLNYCQTSKFRTPFAFALCLKHVFLSKIHKLFEKYILIFESEQNVIDLEKLLQISKENKINAIFKFFIDLFHIIP